MRVRMTCVFRNVEPGQCAMRRVHSRYAKIAIDCGDGVCNRCVIGWRWSLAGIWEMVTMTTKYQNEINWQRDAVNVDPESLNEHEFRAYEAMREANAKARDAKQAFEAIMQKRAPAGTHFVFGYRFGRLAIVCVEGVQERAKAAPSRGRSIDEAFPTSRPGSKVHRI